MSGAWTHRTAGKRSWFARLHAGQILLWIAAIAAAVAMVYLFVSLRQTVWSYFSDGISIREDALTADVRMALFEEPYQAIADFNIPSAPHYANFTPDEASMLLSMRRGGTNEAGVVVATNDDLFVSAWNGTGWMKPVPLSSVNTASNEIGAAVSRDGRYLYVTSDRAGGFGGYDIWIAAWDGTNWAGITNAGPSVNSPFDEVDPAVSPDGNRFCFASNRKLPDARHPGESVEAGFDIFIADVIEPEIPAPTNTLSAATNSVPVPPSPKQKRQPPPKKGAKKRLSLDVAPAPKLMPPPEFGNVARLPAVNSDADDRHVSYTPRGDFLFFASNRRGGVGGFDIYRSRIVGGVPQAPRSMGYEINSESDDLSPSTRMEGFDLLFSSNRGLEDKGTFMLWAATAREVVPRMDYSRIDRLIGNILAVRWWILAFLVALFLLIYLIRHFKDLTDLFHKCLMGSAIVHAALVLLLSSWKISSKIVESAEAAPRLGGEISININALAREKLAVEIADNVVKLPQSDVTVVAKQADQYLPLPDFTPLESSPLQTIVARSTAEAVLMENAPSAPREASVSPDRERPVSSAPQPKALPELQAPELNVVMETRTGATAPAAGKPMEQFEPVVNVPGISAVKIEYAGTGDLASAMEPAVSGSDQVARATASAVGTGRDVDSGAPGVPVPNTGGSIVRISRGGDVSAGPASLNGPGDIVSLHLASLGKDEILRSVLPGELAVPPGFGNTVSPYMMRKGGRPSLTQVEGLGGSGVTEGAVGRALDWFSKHQEPDGRWSIQKYGGKPGHDVAASGLPLLCYLGWGVKHNEAGKYQPAAARAVEWLCTQVKPDGDARGHGGDMYDQGIASIALCEAYALSKDKALGQTVSNMVQFIVKAQNEKTGGWRYHPGQPGDTSVFGWQLMAVMSARMAGVAVPKETLEGADKWLTSVGGGERGGLYGYENRNPANAMAAEGMFCRQIMGIAAEDPRMRETAAFLMVRLPDSAQADIYYWYYGTLALYQHGGAAWDEWNYRLKTVLPPLQATSGDDDGSWNPKGVHSGEMGRVVSTAMATLSLEVYYRYLPFAFTKGGAPAPESAAPAPAPAPREKQVPQKKTPRGR